VAIAGGRNIGSHYFGVDTHANFRDLDIAAAGPLVREVSATFDRFWNSDWSVPIKALVDRAYTPVDLQTAISVMRKNIAEHGYPYPLDEDVAVLKSELQSTVYFTLVRGAEDLVESRGSDPLLGDPLPAGAAGTDFAVAPSSITDKIDVGVYGISRPMPLEIIEKGRPV